jgi:hypothetical protein
MMSGPFEGWGPVPAGEIERLGIRLRAKRHVEGWVNALAVGLALAALALSLFATGTSIYNQFWANPKPSPYPIVSPIKSAYINPQPLPAPVDNQP